MASELWEIVKVTDLKPGDEIRFPDGERYFWTDDDASALEGCTNHYPDKVRRYTGPSSEVLMRAIENLAHNELWGVDHRLEGIAEQRDRWIKMAEAELAKEADDGPMDRKDGGA